MVFSVVPRVKRGLSLRSSRVGKLRVYVLNKLDEGTGHSNRRNTGTHWSTDVGSRVPRLDESVSTVIVS